MAEAIKTAASLHLTLVGQVTPVLTLVTLGNIGFLAIGLHRNRQILKLGQFENVLEGPSPGNHQHEDWKRSSGLGTSELGYFCN